jgi:molybdopterin/thiamine biosynthesis adenylyltransferase
MKKLEVYVACKKDLNHKRQCNLIHSSLDILVLQTETPEFHDVIVDCHINVTQHLLPVRKQRNFLLISAFTIKTP